MANSDVFEITDFTTASDWERFMAGLTEVLQEWRLHNPKRERPLAKGELASGKWLLSSQEVRFADFTFRLERHWLHRITETVDVESTTQQNGKYMPTDETDELPQALHDMMATDNDFCCRNTHCLTQWYGLRDFLLIAPAIGSHAITNESRSKLLLSSLTIALNDIGCSIPAFVQLRRRDEQLYVGVCEGGTAGVATHYQMAHLHMAHPNNPYERLAGILELFKSKLGIPYNCIPPVNVSVSFTYVLSDGHRASSWPQPAPSFDFGFPCVGNSELSKLPFGCYADPIREILLSAVWPQLTENVAVDNSVHSDLDPIHAPLWTVRVRLEEYPDCLLCESLIETVRSCERRETITQLLGGTAVGIADPETDPGIAYALDRLSGGSLISTVPSSVSTAVIKTKRRLQQQAANTYGGGPIPYDKLKDMLFYLFPDAVGKAPDAFDKGVFDSVDDEDVVTAESLKVILAGFKSCPIDSLLYSTAVVMCHARRVYGGIRAVAHLWHEILLELRHRWENGIVVPGLESGSPDLSKCLLYQKFQMLNYCIEKKRAREYVQAQKRTDQDRPSSPSATSDDDDDEDEDEFYECDSEQSPSTSASTDQFVDSVTHAPEGRLRRLNDWNLAEVDEPFYIPITQEPSPMTEDQLEEHADVLIRLGEDEEGAHLRAQMQSACLLSDMQAFKAANPGCILEDFVRWYSPRDWIEEGDVDDDDDGQKDGVNAGSTSTQTKTKRGHLSSRMKIPGNVWLDVWTRAKPVPARRQKRLFDDTKEGEKVLHYLCSLKPADVLAKLMPMLMQKAIITVFVNRNRLVPSVCTALETVARDARDLSKSAVVTSDQYEELVDMLNQLEVTLSRTKALQTIFSLSQASTSSTLTHEVDDFVQRLLDGRLEVELPGGSRTPIGRLILDLFRKSAKTQSESGWASDGNKDKDEDEDDVAERMAFRLPNPERREYVLRCSVARPAPYSTPTPQRLHCCSTVSGDFRFIGAFSRDTAFT